MAVVANASVAPCAPQETCLSVAVTIRSRLSDPGPLSDLTAWQRLKESDRVTIGLRKESIFHCPQGSWSHWASSTASDIEYASAARVLRTTRLIVLLVQ